MNLILIDVYHQARSWIKERGDSVEKYNASEMRGILTDGFEFMFILKQHEWLDSLHGLEIESYENIGFNALTLVQETRLKSITRIPAKEECKNKFSNEEHFVGRPTHPDPKIEELETRIDELENAVSDLEQKLATYSC